MMRTRISGEVTVSQGRIAYDTNRLSWGASGKRWKTNQFYRRTSVLKEDGTTRAEAVTAAIRRGAPMIDDG